MQQNSKNINKISIIDSWPVHLLGHFGFWSNMKRVPSKLLHSTLSLCVLQLLGFERRQPHLSDCSWLFYSIPCIWIHNQSQLPPQCKAIFVQIGWSLVLNFAVAANFCLFIVLLLTLALDENKGLLSFFFLLNRRAVFMAPAFIVTAPPAHIFTFRTGRDTKTWIGWSSQSWSTKEKGHRAIDLFKSENKYACVQTRFVWEFSFDACECKNQLNCVCLTQNAWDLEGLQYQNICNLCDQ